MTEHINKKIRFCNLIVAVLGALLAILVKTIAAPCSSMVSCTSGTQFHMCCYYTGVAAFWIGILICAMGIEHAISGNKGVLQYFVAMIILEIAPLRSVGFGVCTAGGMACSVTKMCIWIVGGLIGIVACFQFLIKGEKDV